MILWRLARPNASALALIGAAVLLVVAGIIGVLNWMDAAYRSGSFSYHNLPPAQLGFLRTGVDAGWGVILMTLAAWAGMASTAYQLWKDQSR